jgi:hypothetical protein|tara:strand:- start:403 stop:765 length:363 start_codon:yes stop_codon:yes gene_type:complete
MAKKGLRSWVKENWVDIANKKSDGSYPKCGRSGGEKRKNYPKCVPIAKARAMSKGQRAGAVRRKQAKANVGPTPDRAATFAKRKNAAMGGYMGPNISGKYDGVELSNPTYRKYYGSKIIP